MAWRNDFWGGYAPSKPIEVEGGIKAKSKRGSIGDTWWSKRWVGVLESFGWSNRLERGRRYARKGQVLDFELSAGKVEATVQGSVRKPYSVTIEIKPIAEGAWDHVIEEMSQKAIFAAKLLAGEMPDDIEDAFEAAGMSLFPGKSKDIKTYCSCPDSANPCKHIAALYYILAENLLMSGDLDKAVETSEKAVSLNDGFGESWWELTKVYYITQNFDKANESLIKTVELGYHIYLL